LVFVLAAAPGSTEDWEISFDPYEEGLYLSGYGEYRDYDDEFTLDYDEQGLDVTVKGATIAEAYPYPGYTRSYVYIGNYIKGTTKYDWIGECPPSGPYYVDIDGSAAAYNPFAHYGDGTPVEGATMRVNDEDSKAAFYAYLWYRVGVADPGEAIAASGEIDGANPPEGYRFGGIVTVKLTVPTVTDKRTKWEISDDWYYSAEVAATTSAYRENNAWADSSVGAKCEYALTEPYQ
jgi:hypothetical protein